MSGSGNPASWKTVNDPGYGVPQPQFVTPAAYVNKQAAEWPQDKLLPPCLIPPPITTLVGNMLTVGGSSIALPIITPERGEFTPVAPASPGDVSGVGLFTVTGINNGWQTQLNCAFQNTGADAITSAIVKLRSPVRFRDPGVSNQVVITIGSTVLVSTYANILNGIIIPLIPAGATVDIAVKAQTVNTSSNIHYTYTASCTIGIRGGPNTVEFDLSNNDTNFSYLVTVDP